MAAADGVLVGHAGAVHGVEYDLPISSEVSGAWMEKGQVNDNSFDAKINNASPPEGIAIRAFLPIVTPLVQHQVFHKLEIFVAVALKDVVVGRS